MGKPITIRRLPKGTTVYVAYSNDNPHHCDWQSHTLVDDLLLEQREGWSEFHLPAKLQALIPNAYPQQMRWTRRQADSGPIMVYFDVVDVVDYIPTWPDGSSIQDDEHFEAAAGGLLLEYVDTLDRGYTIYDLFNHKDRIIVSKLARKYKGKTASWYVWANAIPAGAKPGLYFRYSDGTKAVHVDDIVKAGVPKERKEAVSKGPTFRQVFVPGTTWKVTEEISLPGFDRKSVQYPNGHRGFDYTLVEGKGGAVAVGTEFKVDEKSTTYGPNYEKGIWMKIRFDGSKQQWARISDVNGKVERIMFAQPSINADGTVNIDPKDVIPVYYIFDTALGKYYKEPKEAYYAATDNAPTYSDKGTRSCKNWKRIADVRRAVMEYSGYYHDLPGNDRYDNYYTGGPKKFDIPDTWEIHEIDKTTKQVVRKIELVESLKRSWRLRALTVKYGSAVRAVYSDLEKKKKLEEFSAVMVFTKRDADRYYDEHELSQVEKDDIALAFSNVDLKEYKSSKTYGSHAYAIKDAAAGVMIRLCYAGDLECKVIDLNHMAEVAGEELGASEVSEQIQENSN